MKFTAMIKTKYNSEKILFGEWAIISAVAALMFFAFYYVDLESLTIWTTYFLDSIFDGHIMDVYQYGYENIYHSSHEYIGTNIFVFIPWAVWNIPIWIMQRFFNIQIVEHSTMLLWSKMFLVLMLVLSVYFAFKIVEITSLNRNEAWWVAILSLSYPYTYLGVFYAGQSDVICVCLFTAAVYLLLKGKNGWFYFLSSCAIATKPFYLLSYIAIILLLEKNIVKIVLKLVAGCGITLFLSVLYNGAPMYKESMENGPMNQILENILGGGYSSFATTASYLIFALVLIYFLAYLTKVTREDRSSYIIYFIVIPLLVHFMFAGFEHYRMILLSPFLFIMFMQKKEYFRINMIVNLVISFCAMLCIINFSKYILSTEFMDGTFITNFFGRTSADARRWYNLQSLFREGIENFKVLAKGMAGAYGGGAFILILINHPRFKRKFAVETEQCERWVLWGNMFLIIPFVMLAFLCYYNLK